MYVLWWRDPYLIFEMIDTERNDSYEFPGNPRERLVYTVPLLFSCRTYGLVGSLFYRQPDNASRYKCNFCHSTTTTTSPQAGDLGLAALPGYQVSVFTTGASTVANPDAVIVDNGHVFIDYQNTTAKDCTDKNSSTIVEYTMDGKSVKSFSVPGHSDGMRADPTTHLLWVTSCEDGNAKMNTIDPTSGTVTPYTFPTAPHGGGYDDLFFVNGMTFVAASNPNLDKNGN